MFSCTGRSNRCTQPQPVFIIICDVAWSLLLCTDNFFLQKKRDALASPGPWVYEDEARSTCRCVDLRPIAHGRYISACALNRNNFHSLENRTKAWTTVLQGLGKEGRDGISKHQQVKYPVCTFSCLYELVYTWLGSEYSVVHVYTQTLYHTSGRKTK